MNTIFSYVELLSMTFLLSVCASGLLTWGVVFKRTSWLTFYTASVPTVLKNHEITCKTMGKL